MKQPKIDDEGSLRAEMLKLHGPLMRGHPLAVALGYPSLAALRQARHRNQPPVEVFSIKSRRGTFALTVDVARWLESLKSGPDKRTKESEQGAA
jgi:hypothetical protein